MPIIHCKYDALVDPTALNYHPKNRNKHPKDQIARLAKIIEYQGWRYAIKVSKRSGFVTSGHGRIAAALLKKWNEVPVVYQDYENEDQEYADLTADNAIASWAELDLSGINLDIPDLGPDFNIDLLGIKDFEIEPADKYADKDADAVPEVKETDIKLGDLFQLGNHRLLCGDATDKAQVERLMNGEKADMVYTDPPYGISVVKDFKVGADLGVAKKGNYSPIVGDETTETAIKSFAAVKDLATTLVFWGGNYYANELPPSKCWFIWDKRSDSGIENTFADAEIAWTNLPGATRIYRQLWNGMVREGERDKRVHPTQKPIALAEWCFTRALSEIVLDVFLGSGSTLIACEKSNRKCFGMEIDPQYCQVIIDRWEKFTGQKAVKL